MPAADKPAPAPPPAASSADLRVALDVPYRPGGTSDPANRQALDIYAPHHGSNLPVVVYVHGGGWRYGDRKDVDAKPVYFVHAGFVFVSIGYRLVPDAGYADQCADVAHALRWLRDHIVEHGGDPDRIHLLGFSAGAPLVALVVSDPRYLAAAGVPREALRTITGLDGDCYRIDAQMAMADPHLVDYLKTVWGNDPAGWADPSPVTHLRPGRPYPAFLVVHISSRPDSTWQAHALAAQYQAAGGTAEVCSVDTTHQDLNRDIGAAGDPTTRRLLTFLARHA